MFGNTDRSKGSDWIFKDRVLAAAIDLNKCLKIGFGRPIRRRIAPRIVSGSRGSYRNGRRRSGWAFNDRRGYCRRNPMKAIGGRHSRIDCKTIRLRHCRGHGCQSDYQHPTPTLCHDMPTSLITSQHNHYRAKAKLSRRTRLTPQPSRGAPARDRHWRDEHRDGARFRHY